MFIRDGRDYIYFCKQRLLDKESEVEIFSNEYLKIKAYPTEDKKSYEYFRLMPQRKSNIKMLTKTLVLTIPKSKLKYKILLNLTMNDLLLVQISFKGTSYIVFGKTCTEENI